MRGRSNSAEGLAETPSTVELRSLLDGLLRPHLDEGVRVVALDRCLSPYSTSFRLEELDAHLSSGGALRLMFKDVSPGALLEGADRAKPSFLYDPLREIEVYRDWLSGSDLGTAICYGTIVDNRSNRYWLFLERVPGVELYQVGDFSVWIGVARWLARMHSRFMGETELLSHSTRLLRYEEEFYKNWMARAREFLGRWPATAGKLDALAEVYDALVEGLVLLPGAFIHGEFYASNVLTQAPGDAALSLRVCPVDWEMAAVGPPLIDLAALTAGKWTEDKRRSLALAYHDALLEEGVWTPSRDEMLRGLDLCRLHIAVQWLGWSPNWQPPPEHAHDWLSEALRLAEKLAH